MAGSVYTINKKANAVVEFKGLKAQYIWYLGGGLVALMILFAILYVIGVNTYVCLAVILIFGGVLFSQVYKMSNTYGEHGLMKEMAKRMLPKVIRNNSRRLFMKQ